ncbi:hypothetical protein SYNPS1DRAFT_21544 [Syncephalis pseudoplumigaleata]|uniref:Mucoidy inhibitor A n=1 Tax=Syncephalis pseudoplumigaleata TaxID=1712513 RepID=A0A4P9Z304_9FUNG|nr:hypothetical protein SYNPS1DRAFT_21544 [Syncephalis pseudoplumigaleata]|eukprot:RKP26758.1 hypothetical protein SYNPS1DRAFT_21544 [Syncephalis pseudoplumigaleata]
MTNLQTKDSAATFTDPPPVTAATVAHATKSGLRTVNQALVNGHPSGNTGEQQARFTTIEPNRATVQAHEHPPRQVVVYADRAEVTRLISGLPLKFGQNEVTITGLSRHIERDSIRVEGIGEPVVQDVSYKLHRAVLPPRTDDDGTDEQNANKARLHKLRQQVTLLVEEGARLEGEQRLLEGYARHYTRGTGDKCTSIPDVLHGGSLDAFQRFRTYYAEASRELGRSILANKQELAEAKSLLEGHEATLAEGTDHDSDGNATATHRVEECTQVTVMIDAEEDTSFDLTLSYVVLNASWRPRYDIRVENDAHRLTLVYMAEIRQATDEAWDDVQMTLSTAQPSLGGDAPELSMWTVQLQSSMRHVRKRTGSSKFSPSAFSPGAHHEQYANGIITGPGASSKMLRSSTTPLAQAIQKFSADAGDDDEAASDEAGLGRIGISGMNYEIPARATIPCDNVPHKVTVAMLNMVPELCYAKVKNESDYALLPGQANIFLDNSFVAKSTLKHVSPQESFECSLGIDPAVRITYPPRSKREQTAGFLISRQQTIRFSQRIEIKNTRAAGITVLVSDQVPVSEEEKLQVRLVEPSATAVTAASRRSAGGGGGNGGGSGTGDKDKGETEDQRLVITGPKAPRINDKQCLEWVLRIEAGRTEKLQFSYELAFPLGESVLHIE